MNTKNENPQPLSLNEGKMSDIDYDFELYKILLEDMRHDHTRVNDNFKLFLTINTIFIPIIGYLFFKFLETNVFIFGCFIFLTSLIGMTITFFSIDLLLRILKDEEWKFIFVRELRFSPLSRQRIGLYLVHR